MFVRFDATILDLEAKRQATMNILSVNKFFWRKGGSESVFFDEKEMLESAGHTVIPFSMQGKRNKQTSFSRYFVNEVDYSRPGLANKLLSASVTYSVPPGVTASWLAVTPITRIAEPSGRRR